MTKLSPRPITVTVTPQHVERAYNSYENPWSRNRPTFCPIQIAIAERLGVAVSRVSVDQDAIAVQDKNDKSKYRWLRRTRYYEPSEEATELMDRFDEDKLKVEPLTEPVTFTFKRDLEAECGS